MLAPKPPVAAMKRYCAFFILLPFLLGACTPSARLAAYESEELIAVRHNQETDCTLLIYRDPTGDTRHVFRKHGVFELGILYTMQGEILLKERGRTQRTIEALEADRVTRRINDLLRKEKHASSKHLSNT